MAGGTSGVTDTGPMPSPVADVRPLHVGPWQVWPPVVLAPMAGITTPAFRALCRAAGAAPVPADRPGVAGLYVSEMVTSRGLVERDAESLRLVRFGADETPRSLQLYGVDPEVVGAAVAMVADEDLADHIDLNFGCPVPKVTRKGGGSALPYKRRLFARIVEAAVSNAGRLPVTVKLRKGIDDEHLTYLDAGRLAQEEGAATVALHGRTAAQMYSGEADWEAIARLKASLSVPVLGNGDIWTAQDALDMMTRTGCDGVVVGRGCLGRPWLFAEISAAFEGAPAPAPPSLGEVRQVLRRHAELLTAELGELKAMRDLRKHMAWYLKGFAVGGPVRSALGMVASLVELDALLAELDPEQPFPHEVASGRRGRTTGVRRVVLPEGWLEDAEDLAVPAGAEIGVSGG